MSSEEIQPREWLRCNNCFCLMRKAENPFSFTVCGHIFCSECVRKATKQCPQCKSQDVSAMSLIEPLNPKVKHCFESSEELQEKLGQAYLFQTMQYSINCKRLDELNQKYAVVKAEYQRESKEMKSLKEKVVKCQIRESELKSKLKLVKRRDCTMMMTPLSNVSSVAGCAQSIGSLDNPNAEGHQFSITQPFQHLILTHSNLQGMDPKREFRIPSVTKVPRSVGSSSRISSNSSRGTPFSNYTIYSRKE